MTGANSSTYRTLDLVKAVSFGWAAHKDLNATETQVLQFVALRGKTNETDYAFAWFPLGGQDWWAAHMGMTTNKLKHALSGLRKKNLLTTMNGSSVDARFFTVKGYAIHINVMEDVVEWYESRADIRFTRAPHTVEKFVDNDSECFTKVRDTHFEVRDTHSRVRDTHFDTPSDQGFCPTYPVNKPEEGTQLFTQRPSPSGTSLLLGEDPLRYEDEWSAPNDSVSGKSAKRPAIDDFDVPKEVMQKRERPTSAANRMAEVFHSEWSIARQQRKMLAVPWSNKTAFIVRIKDVLKDHTEEEVVEMIVVFFRMVLAGQVTLRSTELWKDFYNSRAKVASIAKQRTTIIDSDSQKELERWRKRVQK